MPERVGLKGPFTIPFDVRRAIVLQRCGKKRGRRPLRGRQGTVPRDAEACARMASVPAVPHAGGNAGRVTEGDAGRVPLEEYFEVRDLVPVVGWIGPPQPPASRTRNVELSGRWRTKQVSPRRDGSLPGPSVPVGLDNT